MFGHFYLYKLKNLQYYIYDFNNIYLLSNQCNILCFCLIPLPGGSRLKSQDGGNPISIIAHSLYRQRFMFFNLYTNLLNLSYVLISFPLFLYVTPMCFFFSLDIIITQTNYVQVLFNTIIQQLLYFEENICIGLLKLTLTYNILLIYMSLHAIYFFAPNFAHSFSTKISLKNGPMALFTHLKIILL